jgi:hypothetical protein
MFDQCWIDEGGVRGGLFQWQNGLTSVKVTAELLTVENSGEVIFSGIKDREEL